MTKAAEIFQADDRVSHAVFGAGTIKMTDSYHTTIVFDEHGPKRFLTQMLQLERSDAPPRKKPGRTAKAVKSEAAK